jgi:hypothetical protein
MQCRDATERMADLFFGQLPPEAHQELEGHLETCDACREERAVMREALGALRRFTDAESTHPVTPTDIEAITDMAALAHSRSEPGARSGGWIVSPWRRVGRAAALLLAAVGLASLFAVQISVEDGRLMLAFGLPGSTAPTNATIPTMPTNGAGTQRIADGGPVDLWEQHSRAVSNGDALVDATPPEMQLMVQQAVQDALGPALRDLVMWLASNEARRDEGISARQRTRDEFFLSHLAATRNDIRTTRDTTIALYEVVSDTPSLRPDR